jgi:predicted nucleic acid-binding Zn ribbon protein
MDMQHTCPHCKNPIYDDDALLCLFCGESLNRGKRFPAAKPVFFAILLILLISFLLMFFRR